jgi:hypothetical protein
MKRVVKADKRMSKMERKGGGVWRSLRWSFRLALPGHFRPNFSGTDHSYIVLIL